MRLANRNLVDARHRALLCGAATAAIVAAVPGAAQNGPPSASRAPSFESIAESYKAATSDQGGAADSTPKADGDR